MDDLISYAPVIMVVLIYFVQTKQFVKPEELEKKHREILSEVEIRFAPIVTVDEIKSQMLEIKEKIDKIYDFFLEIKHK